MDAARRLVRATFAWPVHTQMGSRRNALVASTALMQRRREREDVEAFLAHRWGRGLGFEAPFGAAEADEARRDVI